MGSIDGFMKVKRDLPETRDPKERIKDYKEFYVPHSEQLTRNQASRCMDCGVPFCHQVGPSRRARLPVPPGSQSACDISTRPLPR